TAVISAFENVRKAVMHVFRSIGISGEALGSVLGTVVSVIADTVGGIADFIGNLDPTVIKIFAGALVGLVGGFKVFNFLKAFNPFAFFARNGQGALDQLTQSTGRSKSTITQLFTGL